jgi:hypothetical protein
MKLQPETQSFSKQIGAIPQKFQKFRSIFTYQGSLMIIKISRTPKPFWGIPGSLLDALLELNPENLYCVFLINENEGWLYKKEDIQRMVRSKLWNKGGDGEYKINPPHEDRLQFSTIQKFTALFTPKTKNTPF